MRYKTTIKKLNGNKDMQTEERVLCTLVIR